MLTQTENRKTLEAQALLNEDIKKMDNDGFHVAGTDKTITVDIHTMFDHKAADAYLVCTGAYCDLCALSKEECTEKVKNREAFTINRNVDTMTKIFDDLVTDDGETIERRTGDYGIRQGQIHKPIPVHDVKSAQVLHGLLRSFDHFMKGLVHVKAGVFNWSERKGSYKLFVDRSKDALRTTLANSLNIKWDQPDPAGKGGTTTTGNTARLLLHKCCESAINELPEEWQEKINKWGQNLSVILRIVSSKSKVNVPVYKDFCCDLYVFLVDSFPWISITGSVHKVIGHSWELIELNGGYGMGSLDELGMEGCHKVLRGIRTRLSRKISQQANLLDTIRRMWYASDPMVNEERMKGWPYCKSCKVCGHSTRYCIKKTSSTTICCLSL